MARIAGARRVRQSEGPFAVGAYVPPDGAGTWDISRDHFGSQMPMTVFQTASQVIRAVTDRRIAVGVLPDAAETTTPTRGGCTSLSPDADIPRVIARLPFGPRGNARSDGDALAIGYGPQVTSGGADCTLLASENAVDISHSRLSGVFTAVGFNCRLIAFHSQGGTTYTLIEIDGFRARSPTHGIVQLRRAARQRPLPSALATSAAYARACCRKPAPASLQPIVTHTAAAYGSRERAGADEAP